MSKDKDCSHWRSIAFQGLSYLAWHEKATRWAALGREQRFCETCGIYHWVKGESRIYRALKQQREVADV